MKPPSSCCTMQWSRGQVTEIHSNNNISIDGVPRHILDIRPEEDEVLGNGMPQDNID